MIKPSVYDEDYFMRGIETGKSAYENYTWRAELTIPMAMTIIDELKIDRKTTILDYGCAKGYLVKALRLLHRKAYGVDVSRWAINNLDPVVKSFCKLIDPAGDGSLFDVVMDLCISKDVFEHIPETDLQGSIDRIAAKEMFAVIPLGEDGVFRAPDNNLDVTHVTCRPEQWWLDFFENSGWSVINWGHRIEGIKDRYKHLPSAHGFFHLASKKFWTNNR